ncbi:ribosomal protein S18-alanine N-acetyltransferase [Aestuariispira insulae]|uniref:ribosomal protein S18-alanine N-acetyltransferase n=1 Tax=Aestuariispira insulae TaxID=1461337 RepID=UPI0015F2975B|nr:ribosomal protein S18-alanine N-acetyltransferase [Aestuariispira insulae]
MAKLAVTCEALDRGQVPIATAIYARAFDEPWPEAAIADLLKGAGCWGLIASVGGEPVGFTLCRSVLDEVEILTFAVDPERRRLGIGRTMLEEVIRISVKSADSLYLEVGTDNPAALGLYLAAGFKEIGRRKNYYRRADRSLVDALIMRRDLAIGGQQ